MRRGAKLCVILMLNVVCVAWAQPGPEAAAPAGKPPAIAVSRIAAVTVYSSSALVTREVDAPAVKGISELVVGPLPPSTIPSSLYSEGSDGIHVMSTRYRTRVLQENMQEEVRKLEAQLKSLKAQEQDLQKQIQTAELNIALLAKLEGFTSGSLKELTEKGMLKSEEITSLVKFIMETRSTRSAEATELSQKLASVKEQEQYVQREMAKVASGSDKTVREAVLVIDSDRAVAGKVRFNYIVSAASWRPQYKLRASKDRPEVTLEYMAAINQQSGEDWNGVEMVLSTAQPMLNAAPPELAMLDVNAVMLRGQPQQVMVNGGTLNLQSRGANYKQVEKLRQEGQSVYNNTLNKVDADRRFNDAAAFLQSDEILNTDMQQKAQVQQPMRPMAGGAYLEGQSVTFHLDRQLTVPWRDDEQIIEVARVNFKPDYFYKAIPVLSPHVYRLATLTNESKLVLLPGEATVYVGTDFVGRTSLGLVAIGETFTAGFGVDPQLQVTRQLVEKSRSIQGGNQVLKFDYRLAVASYKSEAVKLQLWDRLPHPETEAVNVAMVSTSRELSGDAAYQRDDRPKNLLRWDLTVEANARGEKAPATTYEYKMEFAREASIGNFLSK